MAVRTVPLRLSLVNTVLPMEGRGDRLRRFLIDKTGGRHGWVNALEEASGVRRQTLSAAMGARSNPDLATITAIADAIGVRPFELLAAMDGDVAVSLADPRAQEAIREAVEAEVSARLGPRQEPPGRAGAA